MVHGTPQAHLNLLIMSTSQDGVRLPASESAAGVIPFLFFLSFRAGINIQLLQPRLKLEMNLTTELPGFNRQ
jgi:hypothetical protein